MIGQEIVIGLIHQFLNQQIDAETFCTQFTDLWTQNRNAMYAKKLTWPEPYDEQLIAVFQRGEITDQEFSESFAQLWGYADALPLQNMINAIHSACSVFRSVPTQNWEIDEPRLRLDVTDELASYKLGSIAR